MVFNKLRQLFYIQSEVKTPFKDLISQLEKFRGTEVMALCPMPTDNSWQGVFVATQGLFGEKSFVLPQYYSQKIYSDKELTEIATQIANLNIGHVVFSGYLPYFDTMIKVLAQRKVQISIIYHGSHTSVLEDPNAACHFKRFRELLGLGYVSKVGFVKKDMEKTMGKLTRLRCFPVLLKTNDSIFGYNVPTYSGTHIGVLTNDTFRKNLYNQVSGALLVDNAVVHLKASFGTDYLANNDRIKTHGFLKSRIEFLHLLGSMTANLYVSFSECWGQVVAESLALGVPCLTSDVSAVLDFDAELKEKLVVAGFDNDYAIYQKLQIVLEQCEWFRNRGPEYVKRLNSIAEDNLNKFLFS